MHILEATKYGDEGFLPKYPCDCPLYSRYGEAGCCVTGSASSMCNFHGRVKILTYWGKDITDELGQIFILCGEDDPNGNRAR